MHDGERQKTCVATALDLLNVDHSYERMAVRVHVRRALDSGLSSTDANIVHMLEEGYTVTEISRAVQQLSLAGIRLRHPEAAQISGR